MEACAYVSTIMSGSPYNNNQIGMEKYVFKEKLGEGSYGVVWRVLREGTNNSYAIKVIEGVNFFRKEEV
jgi:serine/threonine protein kinase